MMQRRVIPAQVSVLGDNEVEVRMSTASVARDGHILLPEGARLDNYKANPVVLWNHDADKPPVGRAENVTAGTDEIVARVKFPDVGISQRADEIRGLAKGGFINAVSVGFDPLDGDPIDPKKPRAGMRFTDWDLLELSFCNVPVDTGALVTQRAEKSESWKCGASRNLPVEDSDSWDGAAAEASIFQWAGGDDFDPSKARKAFLAYDAADPKKRGSYKLPIAHVVDGRLKVPKGAIRAAASRLPQTDIPEACKKAAGSVLDHYKEKAGMAEKDSDRSLRVKHTRALERAPKVPTFKRGLHELASLAYLVAQVGYAHNASEYEAALEGDESELPEMLGESLKQLGEALIAMTEEEVEEFIEECCGDEEEDGDEGVEAIEHSMTEADRAYIAAGDTPRSRAWRRGIVLARGRALTQSAEKQLTRALKHHQRADKHHEALGESQAQVGENLDDAQAAHSRAVKTHEELGEHLEAAQTEPDKEKATEHVARAVRAHRALGGHHEAVGNAHAEIADGHEDSKDSHAALGRSLDGAERCVRSVVEGAAPGSEDGDSKEIQTSAGTAESTGSSGGRALSLKQRQRDLAALTLSN